MSGARPHPLRRWLQPLVGVAILAVVLSLLPWRDVLVLRRAEPSPAQEVALVGALDGDWKGDSVAFEVAEDGRPEDVPSWLPAGLGRVELASDGEGRWSVVDDGLAGLEVDLKPGMPRVFASVEGVGLVQALAAFFVAMLFAITRWWRLLNLAGCRVTWLAAFRLSYLGLFFNLVVPGLTGGDVVKAVLAVRENPGRRPDALVSVVVDRLLGMFALAFLASVVILIGDTFASLRLYVPPVMVLILVGAAVYTSQRVRRLVRFDALIERLPMAERIKSLDTAALAYRRHPLELLLAFGLSLGNHVFAVVGVMALGVAFGVPLERVGFFDYLAIVPVANMLSSIPITPGGWGVGEAAYGGLFSIMGVAASLGVAVSVGFRLCQMLLGLAGGLYLLRPGARASAQIAEAESVAGG